MSARTPQPHPPHPHPPQGPRVTRGAILSAGLGARMGALSGWRPKPLLPTCGRPLIEWGLEALTSVGVSAVGVNTHHLADQLKAALWGRGEQITWSHEEVLQGTGGGLRDLWRRGLSGADELIALNGDALFDFDLAPLLARHREGPLSPTHRAPPPVATLMLREVEPGDPFGRVGVDAEGRVVRIAEIEGPRAAEAVRVGAFTGAQVLSARALEALPEGPCDIFRASLKGLMAEGAEVRAAWAPPGSLWVDIGTPARYLHAHLDLLRDPAAAWWGRLPTCALVEGARGRSAVMEGAEVGEGARLTGGAWLYPGARVEGGCAIGEVVVWEGAAWGRAEEARWGRARGVLTPWGFVGAEGGVSEGAAGAPL